jgi:hypothetical protein
MKLALIPPYSQMNSVFRTNYQLVLPEHLSNKHYQESYMMARRNGDYLIMDNGAAEGNLLSPGELRSMSLGLMVNEIVVPDVLGDMYATLTMAKQFFQFGVDSRFKYMGVVQGQSFDECCACVEAFHADQGNITVLGIPRHLIMTCHRQNIRSELALYIKRTHPQYQVHLLGTSPAYIKELKDYQEQFHVAGVRGVDTSAPFNYAYHAKSMLNGEHAGRPTNYFDIGLPTTQALDYNIQLLKTWVDA